MDTFVVQERPPIIPPKHSHFSPRGPYTLIMVKGASCSCPCTTTSCGRGRRRTWGSASASLKANSPCLPRPCHRAHCKLEEEGEVMGAPTFAQAHLRKMLRPTDLLGGHPVPPLEGFSDFLAKFGPHPVERPWETPVSGLLFSPFFRWNQLHRRPSLV